MASGGPQSRCNPKNKLPKHATWIPMDCGTSYRMKDDDDSSIVESIPVSPIPKRENTTFGFSFDQFLSPIMSCMEPNLQTMCAMPECSTSSLFDRDMPETRRPRILTPRTVRRPRPNPNDVLCGKGHNHSSHQGNQNLRDLIAANQETYATLTKKEKQNMSRQIVGLILLHTEPTGRFLAWEASSGMFVDVGLSRSIEKTNQGFRDALVQSNTQRSVEPKQNTHQPKRVQIQIPDHLTDIYSHAPKPQEFIQYPELMNAMKHYTVVPPPSPSFLQVPNTIPGPFPATKPNKPAAIVSPRQYLPSSVRLPPRHSATRKLAFPPGLVTPTSLRDLRRRDQPFGHADSTLQPSAESPRRIHDWKRRRTGGDGNEMDCSFESNNSLTEAMESRLTLNERVVRSPIRTVPKMTRNLNISADSADGHAALAATAFLRLDDSF